MTGWALTALLVGALTTGAAAWVGRRRQRALAVQLREAFEDLREHARLLAEATRRRDFAESQVEVERARADAAETEIGGLRGDLSRVERDRRSLVVEGHAMRRQIAAQGPREPGERRSHTGTLLGIPIPGPDSSPPAPDDGDGRGPSATPQEAAWLRREVARLGDEVAALEARASGLESDLEGARASSVCLEVALDQALEQAQDARAALAARERRDALLRRRRRPTGVTPLAAGAVLDSDDPDEARIRERAFRLWDAQGRPVGRDEEFWLRAESELRADG